MPESSPADLAPARDVPAALPAERVAEAPDDLVGAPSVVTGERAPRLLFGSTVDDEGAPLAGVSVSFQTGDDRRIQAKSDGQGRWSLATYEVGSFLFRARKRNHETDERTVELAPTDESRRLDFTLTPQQVVRVDLLLPDGEPALPALEEAGISVYGWSLVPVATQEDPGATFTEVAGSLNNRFGIGGFWQPGMAGTPQAGPETIGFVTLYQPAPAWMSLVASHQVLAKQPIDAADEVVTFTILPEDFRSLEARVIASVVAGEDGRPLRCSALVSEDPFAMGDGADCPGGRVDLGGQRPGRRYLVLQAPERATVIREIVLERGDTLDLGEIPMHAPVRISGRLVTDVDPPPVGVLRFGRRDPETDEVVWNDRTAARTDREGAFVLEGLEPGVWMVGVKGVSAQPPARAERGMASRTVRVDARSGSVEGVELVLEQTTKVILATGKVSDDARYVVSAFDEDGHAADHVRVGKHSSEAELVLTPGSWDLVLTRDGEEVGSRGVAVGATPARLEWPLR